MMKRYALFALLLFAIPASATQGRSGDQATQTISPAPSFTPVTNERLLNSDAEPENWLHYSGNYFSQRYSGLDQINSTNAGELEMQWAFQLRVLDRVVLVVFIVELILRVLSFRPRAVAFFERSPQARLRAQLTGRLMYLLQPLNLVDLLTVLALVPALRGLRALRLLRLLRSERLFRYSQPFLGVQRAIRDNMLLYVAALGWLMMMSCIGGLSIWLVEGDTNEGIHSIFDGLWWALVTITTCH